MIKSLGSNRYIVVEKKVESQINEAASELEISKLNLSRDDFGNTQSKIANVFMPGSRVIIINKYGPNRIVYINGI